MGAANIENKESGPQNLEVFSSPLAPTMIEPTEVSRFILFNLHYFHCTQIHEHSAVVTWNAPERLGTGVELVHYVLEYSISGSEDVKQIVVQENRCELTDLAMGSEYSFNAKVLI